ncbi:MAG TPA: peptidoglycan-binding domain-containing protein [Candidatus Paceibacterota bacterium]|nr:peptidoglycan-binding domain-containing protein [Candidatus Paceibacterota bacterium]
MEKNNTKALRNVLIAIAALVVIGAAFWFTMPRSSETPFCYNFAHDMQFGDRTVAHPVNQGFRGTNGMYYYIPEVPALQKALSKQGFYIDPYESTGGQVYVAPFFGPSTRVAVESFQKKYSLPMTGQVTNDTLDKLRSLYGCPATASSTTAGFTYSTSTLQK